MPGKLERIEVHLALELCHPVSLTGVCSVGPRSPNLKFIWERGIYILRIFSLLKRLFALLVVVYIYLYWYQLKPVLNVTTVHSLNWFKSDLENHYTAL